VNPALPGGALLDSTADASQWSTTARAAYTFVPYGRLQQGRDTAPNPNGLGIDVHLATLQLSLAAPTGTSLDLQLPAGSLVTTTLGERRTDSGVGDLEVRVRQAITRIGPVALGATLGIVAPTGSYVARSGAANLAPEASYLTLGRGVAWWIGELDARMRAAGLAVSTQLSARGPLSRTDDGFAWGPEARATLAVQRTVRPWLSLVGSTDLQWRGGASEPDPFGPDRLMSANAGGWQWTVSPAAAFSVGADLTVAVGARIPIVSDVVGNQLVPQIGGFVAVSYTRRLERPRPRAPAAGRITVVDYWATWCEPCREITRVLAAAATRWPDVTIIKVDATAWPGDGAPALPAGASGLPAVEVFDASGKRRVLLLGQDALRVVDEVDALRTREGSRTCERTNC
jgi:thiol-disulfide isomerase/thioredoxin